MAQSFFLLINQTICGIILVVWNFLERTYCKFMRYKRLIMLLSAIIMLSVSGCSSSVSNDIVQETEMQTDVDACEISEEVEVSDSTEDAVTSIFTFDDMENVLMCASTSVNVRNLPSRDGMRIDELCKNQEIMVTGQCNETGWFRVQLDNCVGYVCFDYLIKIEPESESLSASPLVGHELEDDSEMESEQSVRESVSVTQGEAGVSQDMILSVEKYYNKLPENIRLYFQNSGWKITVSAQGLGERYGYSFSILALTIYEEQQIWIDNRSSAKGSIVHEMGHFIDCTQNWVSRTPEFAEIYAAEKEAFCLYHGTHQNNTNTVLEYFAEAFQQCIYDSEGMQAACPRTYEYVMQIASSL